MKQIINLEEAIAIAKYKREVLERDRNLVQQEKLLIAGQIGILDTYIDGAISEVRASLNTNPVRERIVIHSLHDTSPMNASKVSQIPNVTPEVTKDTETTSIVHVPTPTEVLTKAIEEPKEVESIEDAYKEQILALMATGTQANKLHAIYMTKKLFRDLAKTNEEAKILINSWLNIDPLLDFKKHVCKLYSEEGYTAAYSFVKRNLPSSIVLTTNLKDNEGIMHRFTRSAIDESIRKDEIERRRAKKVA